MHRSQGNAETDKTSMVICLLRIAFNRMILCMLNILSARESVKSFDEPIAEDVTISCNICGIHPFRSRYKTWVRPSSCRTLLEFSSASF